MYTINVGGIMGGIRRVNGKFNALSKMFFPQLTCLFLITVLVTVVLFSQFTQSAHAHSVQARSAQTGSPHESPQNPWAMYGIEVGSGSCSWSMYGNNIYYPSPAAILADSLIAFGGGDAYSSYSGTIGNSPAYSYNIENAPCFTGGYFYISMIYDGTNFGKVCPGGSYEEGGQFCPGNAPSPKTLGSNGCPVCSQNTSESSNVTTTSKDGKPQTRDPIDVASGNVYEQETDYQSAGMNWLDFTRYYNSNAEIANTYAVSLGSHWRNTYDRYLDIISSSSVTVERKDGKVLSFTNNGSGWVSDSDVDLALVQTGSTSWTLKDQDDTVETYTQLGSGEGLLNSITLRDGYTQVLAYNSNNQLTSVTDSFGRTLTFSYTGTLLSTVTTPDGLVVAYSYNSSGLNPGVNDRLVGVSYSTSPATNRSYTYTQLFDLLNVTDENGNTTSWTYDVNGRGLSSQNGNGLNLTTVAYDDATGNRTVTNALGQQEVYKFTTLQGVPKVTEIDRIATSTVPAATETYTYDSNGYVNSITDWKGNVTEYVNNTHGLPTSITEASGTGVARTTTITYDATFIHLPDQIVQPRLTTSFTYDGSGNVLTRTETDTSGGITNGQTRTWTYTYDSKGHVLTATGPRTDVIQTTTFTYSGNNITTITDPLGHVSKITSYTSSGLPLSMTDPNGVVTTFTYDIRDRLLTQTVQSVSGNAQTTFSYDGVGNLTQIRLPDNTMLGYGYDQANRLNSFYTSLDNLYYTLDANGDIVKLQSTDNLDTNGLRQSAVFDSLGRMLQQIGAAGQTTSFAYDADGNALTVTDPLGNARTQAFDALNRLTGQTDPLSNTITYARDAQDNLTGVTDPRNLKTTYTYDGFGDVISETSPDSGTITYTFDKAGNCISETDARGVVTNCTFDTLNRVLTETYPASPGENVTYTYDVKSKTNFGIGRLAKIKDESGTTTFTYNERGDILTDTRKIGATTYKTTYTYDLADNVSSVTYPSGDVISYTRDRAGRISSISYQPTSGAGASYLARSITYVPFGPVSGLTYGNGLAETLTYDHDYHLTNILTSGNSVVQNLALSYDAVGNITSITDNLDNTLNQTFGYDKDYRLVSATGKYGAVGYTYDADGNRLTNTTNGTTSTYTYPTTSNKLSSVKTGGVARKFTYLANGDISKDTRSSTSTTAAFSYNDRNFNGKVTINGVVTTYKQNALGERMIKTTGTSITDYQYDLNGHVIAESNGSTGAVTREYVYLDDMPLAQIESNGTIYYLHNDQTGTPQKMTDASENVVWDRIQQPFGETVSITGSATNNLRFPGQYADSESGLNDNLNRSYNSTLGRYTQGDPIGLAGGINLYGYVENNPVIGVDPQGLDVRVYGGGSMWPHEAIAIDTPSGIFTFGFGPRWSGFIPYGPGRVDEGSGEYSNITHGRLISTYPLSPSDGDKLVQNLRKLENNSPLYSLVGFNCNNFANMVASYASQGSLNINSFSPIDFNQLSK